MPEITVFTPSHDPTYLDECYESLAAQIFTNFEWIVLLNGGASWTPPPDPRVQVHIRDPETGKIGALKARACALAHGSILVELDHDDLLTTSALYSIHDVFRHNPHVGFVYSDFAQINADRTPNHDRFAEGHGWHYYDDTVSVGKDILTVQVIEAQPPTPHNVSYIWYAPNHVRAFRRSTYDYVGGYDPSLDICDDIDLMQRMYQHSPFAHINVPLYLQRVHKNNKQRDPETNARIQQETVRIYDENIQPNALIWAERHGLHKLDLGGAHACPTGYVPVDKVLNNRDIFETLVMFPDDSVGVIRAVDFIEHVSDPITLMNEIYRVLAPGGMFLSLTPSTDGRGAFCDPTHVSFWNSLSFRYYCDPEYQKYVPLITARFRQSRLFDFFPTQWHQDNIVPYVCFNGTKDVPHV